MITIVIISLIVSLILFKRIRGFKTACFLSTIVSSLFSWAALQNHFGWFDRVFYENAFMTILIAFGTSLAVGAWLGRKQLNRKKTNEINGTGSN